MHGIPSLLVTPRPHSGQSEALNQARSFDPTSIGYASRCMRTVERASQRTIKTPTQSFYLLSDTDTNANSCVALSGFGMHIYGNNRIDPLN